MWARVYSYPHYCHGQVAVNDMGNNDIQNMKLQASPLSSATSEVRQLEKYS
jgi:hypothetical protein